jgi:hypothetical protein
VTPSIPQAAAGPQVGRVLATSAPPGPDQRYSAVVVRQPGATALSASGRLMYAMTGAHDQVLAAYDTVSGQRVTVLHRWPAAIQPAPLVADPAGRYLLVSVTGTPRRRSFSPQVKGRRCLAVMVVDQGLKCARVSVPQTLFVAINLATGTATTLPFRESGPAGWGAVAW